MQQISTETELSLVGGLRDLSHCELDVISDRTRELVALSLLQRVVNVDLLAALRDEDRLEQLGELVVGLERHVEVSRLDDLHLLFLAENRRDLKHLVGDVLE